jgi:exodeoxyribonuclease VII large subunit
LQRLQQALHHLDPLAVLGRGYALVTGPDGRTVTDASAVNAGDALDVQLARGRLRARAERSEPAPAASPVRRRVER